MSRELEPIKRDEEPSLTLAGLMLMLGKASTSFVADHVPVYVDLGGECLPVVRAEARTSMAPGTPRAVVLRCGARDDEARGDEFGSLRRSAGRLPPFP